MAALILSILGLFVGVLVEGIVSSYHHAGTFWPWPCCRTCGQTAPPRVAIPVVGFWLEASCRSCSRAQRWRGLEIQGATAAAFFLLGGQYWTQPVLLAVTLVEAALLVAVLFIDLELRLIPHVLVALLIALGLSSAALWPSMGVWNALLGGAIGFLSFGGLVVLAHLVFGEGALGMGDANLALAIGCITGYPLVAFALPVGVFLGGIGAIAVMVAGRRGLRSTMPYGPYLVLAVLYVLVRGNTLTPLGHF